MRTENRGRMVWALAVAAGVTLACGGGAVPPPAGRMPITTRSRQALEEYLKGRDLSEKLRDGEARAHFQSAVELDPNFALAHLGLATTAPGPIELFPSLRRAVELAGQVSRAEANLILAAEAGANTRPAEQRRLLEANAKAFPDDERAHNQLGNFLFAARDWQAAIAEYQRATALIPTFAPPYNQLGYALRFLDRDAEAEAAFRTYVELLPNEPNPYDSHAELLLHLGRFRDAIAEYEKALDLNPNFPTAYVGIGYALMFLGDMDEARKSFVKLRFIAQDDGARRRACTWLAASHLFVGDHEGAIAELKERLAIATRKNDRASASADIEFIAETLLDAGRVGEAQARFDEARALFESADVPRAVKETDLVDYLFDCARVKLALGDLKAAAELAERHRARVEERRVPEELRTSHLLAGLLALAAGDPERAQEEIGMANLDDHRALLALARAQAASGDVDKAIGTCRRAARFDSPDLSLAFAHRPAQALLAELQSRAQLQTPTPTR